MQAKGTGLKITGCFCRREQTPPTKGKTEAGDDKRKWAELLCVWRFSGTVQGLKCHLQWAALFSSDRPGQKRISMPTKHLLQSTTLTCV
ncbi:hypothetical protein AAFF_G00250900 [Aldrovandia affinis]|uniref:Uncharacterized protein n=1 Tax=Aldrovandia affinis TaxID=143900 RepID=A0AAD7W3B9_9TELE|nr:hypothetical protein AAFF_G00250900 [Aldrovandia affinis]